MVQYEYELHDAESSEWLGTYDNYANPYSAKRDLEHDVIYGVDVREIVIVPRLK